MEEADGARDDGGVGQGVLKTPSYRTLYALFGWLFPLFNAVAPRRVTTTRELGRAMLSIARDGAPKRVLEAPDLVAIGRPAA